MLSENLLINSNAKKKTFKKGQVIFYEQTVALYYLQVASGQIQMLCFLEDGSSFIQGIFKAGKSFGEPPLIGNFPYPTRAIALEDTEVWMLPKRDFIDILKNNPTLNLKLTKILCHRIEHKACLLKTLCIKKPRNRILSFIDFKIRRSLLKATKDGYFILPLTRQQLADSLSLRVETVIRALKQLELEGEIVFSKKKVCRR